MRLERISALQETLIVVAIGVALVAQQRVHQAPNASGGWLIYAVALALMAFAAWNHAPTRSVAGAPSAPAEQVRRHRLAWGIAAALAVVATTAASTTNHRPVLPLLLWVASFVLGAMALRRWVISPPARQPVPWSRREVAGFIAIVVVGALARALWLDAIPPYFFADTSRVGWFMVLIYRHGIPNFFTMGWNTWPMIGISLQGLFGSFLGVSITSLRMSSALMGTLAVGMTYLLARELFTVRIAVLAALLFAICRTAIDFSRLGVCHAQVLFYETFALFWWWRAVNTGKAVSYWLAGIGLGLCLYTYNAGELVPVLWVGWILGSAVLRPRTVRTHWRGALITAAALAATTVPYLYYATDHLHFGNNWQQFTGMARHRQTLGQMVDAFHASGAGAAAAVLWRQVWLTWLGFGVLPGGSYGLGYRGGGMLDDITAALFMLGLAMAVLQLRRGREAFVPYWWLLTTVAGGVLTIDPPAIVRMVGILPALALLAAMPLDLLWRLGTGSKARAAIGTAAVALLLAGAGWRNWQTYFVIFPREPLDNVSMMGRTLEKLPHTLSAFLLGSEQFLNYDYELFHFNFPGRRLEDVGDPAQFLPLHEPIRFPVALMLGQTQLTLVDYIRTLYPHTRVTDVVRKGENRVLFRELLLTPDDVRAQTGLRLTAYDRDGAAVAAQIADPFAPPPLPPRAQRVQWTGRIYWPTDRPVKLTAHADRPVQVRVADGPVVDVKANAAATASIELPRGWQSFSIDEPAGPPAHLSVTIKSAGLARTLTRWDLNPNAAPQGLAAVYTRDGHPVLRAIDPQLDTFAQEFIYRPERRMPLMLHVPFEVSWQGALRVDRAGMYRFEVQASGPYSIELDGTTLLAGGKLTSTVPQTLHAERTLSVGVHPLRAHWDSSNVRPGGRRVFQLYWVPPGGGRALIPPTNFVPAVPGQPPGGGRQ